MANIIFLPGMMCDERIFEHQIKTLKAAKYNIEIAAMDEFDSMQALAENILAKTNFDQFILCGLSMGGILAMHLSKLADSKVQGLILLDTNFLSEVPKRQAKRDIDIARAKQEGFENILKDEMKPLYLEDMQSKLAKSYLNLFYDMGVKLGLECFINQNLALKTRPSYEQVLKDFKKPAMVICGREDKLCPLSRHVQMHELLEYSSLHILGKTGHIASLEQAHTVSFLIKEFLDNEFKKL